MSQTHDDPLLNALTFFGKIHAVPVNPHGATQGLPLKNGRLTPEMFVRAAAKCGFQSKMVKRSLPEIHGATLPILLILNNNDSVILTRVDKGKHAKAEVVVLSSGSGVEQVPVTMLEDAYSGIAILVKPDFTFESSPDFGVQTPRRHWFWSTLWGFRGTYAKVGLATLMINLLALTSSIFIMTVYDRVVPYQATDTLMVLALGVAVAYLFEFALKMLRAYFVDRAGHRIDLKLGSELFARMLGMQFKNRPTSAGALASQARSYESLREFFTSATLAALVDLPFIFFFASIIYLLGGTMVVLPLLAGIGLTLLIGVLMQIPISRAVKNSYNTANQRQALMVEGIHALETVKLTRSESELQRKMEDTVRTAARNDGVSRAFTQFALNSSGFINHLVSMFIVIMAFFQVMEGNMSMGAMIACVLLTGRAMAPMTMVASLLSRLQQSCTALKGISQIMDMPGERESTDSQYLSVDRFSPSINAREVKFCYTPDSDPIIKNLNFHIRPGEKVAVLGRIGSGKSTLLRMLSGLYHPSEGRIDVSGINLRQLDPTILRMNTGFVPQNPILLHGTIRSNLKAGCPWIDDDAMLSAVERTGLMDFIRSIPQGFEYSISEGGTTLSGGQRQALSVARSLIENPSLLLLDEPTSAMDLTSERRLLNCLGDYLAEDKTRTLIIATHKRSVLSLVDRIIVMDDGQIIADGPRDAVLTKTPLSSKPADLRETRTTSPPSNDEDSILAR